METRLVFAEEDEFVEKEDYWASVSRYLNTLMNSFLKETNFLTFSTFSVPSKLTALRHHPICFSLLRKGKERKGTAVIILFNYVQ